MRFEISHEFDIPVDALELAVISPALADKLGAKAVEMRAPIGAVIERSRSLKDGVLERALHYRANVRVPPFAQGYVRPEMLAWEEHSVYEMSRHAGRWTIVPSVKPAWRKYFSSAGTYELASLHDGRSQRLVRGEVELRVGVMRGVAERLIVGEMKKAFEAEAATLREMATLT